MKELNTNKRFNDDADDWRKTFSFIPKKDTLETDDNKAVRRIIPWNGLKIALQYLPFELRHNRILTAGYGHIQNLIGADKMALDCWVGTNLDSDFVAIMEQWIDGKFDEDKVIIGCTNLLEAKALYCANMPSEFLKRIKQISVDDLIRVYSKGASQSNAYDSLAIDTIEDTEYPDSRLSELTSVQIETLKLITAETFTARIDSIDAVFVNKSKNLQWMFSGSDDKFDAELERKKPILTTKVHGAKITGYSSGDDLATDSELAEFIIDKNCIKGLACGNSCISRAKACRRGISGGAAAAGGAIVDQLNIPVASAPPAAVQSRTIIPSTNIEPKPIVTPIEARTENNVFGLENLYSFSVNDHKVNLKINQSGSTSFTVNGSFNIQNLKPREAAVAASKIRAAFKQDIATKKDGFEYSCSAWVESGLRRGRDGNYPNGSPARVREDAYLAMGFKRISVDKQDYNYGALIATVKDGKIESSLRSAQERGMASQARRAARNNS
jgi:Inorganic Pyrophosphatase